MNSIGYFEIQTDDPNRAIAFYSSIFDWKITKQEGMPIDYWHIETGGVTGGLMARPAPVSTHEVGTNAFVCSFEVDDFDAVAEKILAAGGIVALPKFAVPGKCYQGYFQDPEGNTFGLFQPDPEAA